VTGFDGCASVFGDGFEDFRLHAPGVVSEGEPAELNRILDAFEPFELGLPIERISGYTLTSRWRSSLSMRRAICLTI
jgi:hypothetical protein